MSLKEIRTSKGLTLRQLEKLSGVHNQKIHEIESGKIKVENITLKTAEKLAKALDCKAEDLLK
jgi:transcriptional regulator with XRE-family HTH domain